MRAMARAEVFRRRGCRPPGCRAGCRRRRWGTAPSAPTGASAGRAASEASIWAAIGGARLVLQAPAGGARTPACRTTARRPRPAGRTSSARTWEIRLPVARRTTSRGCSEGVGVVAGLGPRLPPQLGVGDGGADPVPVAEVLDGGVQRDARHAGGVVEDLADGHGLLAVGGELRPQLGDQGVVAEQAALGQQVDHGRSRPLTIEKL